MDPWTGNRYAFGAGNPITNVEIDGHDVAPPQCDWTTTPEYCHDPGTTDFDPYELGVEWLYGFVSKDPLHSCDVTYAKCYDTHKTLYFREGDTFTDGISYMPQIQDLRLKIQNQLEYNKAHPDQPAVTSGTYDLHYVDDSAPERAWTAIKNLFSILTGGEVGMPIEQGFTGSYDLSWQFLGYDDNGNAVIEYRLLNASMWASGVPNPLKVFLYPGENEDNQSAGDGHDAAPGEYWLQESVRWRETFDGDNALPPPDANPFGTADNCCVPGL